MSDELAAAHRWGELGGGLAGPAGPLLEAAVGRAAEGGASYADVRLSETQELRLYAVSGRAPDERVEGSLGLGVRVLVNGVWGFASLPLREAGDAALAARLAVRNA
ncbi:MAG TPA: DNA gyrase modulator, partial [Streptosporangiaceae bacterium]|nr:DNA gyrase modulator [Streptosporangiaceae bacterium]